MGPKSSDWCPYKERQIYRQTYREGNRHLRMKAEIDVSIVQGTPTAGNPHNLEREQERLFQHSEEERPF